MASHKNILRSLPGIMLLLSGMHLYALDNRSSRGNATRDSLLPVRIDYHQSEEIAPDLLDAETDYDRNRDDRKGLARLLKIVKVKRLVPDSKRGYKLFHNLARFSARLKLYPLAMKFYYKAEEYKRSTLLSWYR